MSDWRRVERIALVALITALCCYAIYQYVKVYQEQQEVKRVPEQQQEKKPEEPPKAKPEAVAEPEPETEREPEPELTPEEQLANRKLALKQSLTPLVQQEVRKIIDTLRQAHSIPEDSKTKFNGNMQIIETDVLQQISSAVDKMSESKAYAADPQILSQAFINAAQDSIAKERKSFLASLQHREHAIRATLNAQTAQVIQDTADLTGTPREAVSKVITPLARGAVEWSLAEVRTKDPLGLIDRFATTRDTAIQLYSGRLADLYKQSPQRPDATPNLSAT